jgi:hypothetical protein
VTFVFASFLSTTKKRAVSFVYFRNASTSGHVQVCYFIPVLCTDGLDGASTASSLLYIFRSDSLRLLSLIIPDIEFFYG